jgi:hypothetical protein
VTILPASRTPTIAVRVVVLVLALAIPMGVGVWNRLAAGKAGERPTPTATGGERLILPTVRTTPDPSYSYLATQPGSLEPVAFDPCRPIHYVVRPTGAPAGGTTLLTEAIGRISAATGLQFIDDGATDEAPLPDRPNFLPDRYGDRWAPVLVAWSTPEEFAILTGPVIGIATNRPVDVEDGAMAFVSGQVVLDTPQMSELLQYNGGRSLTVAALTHELGHLVGLAHVQDTRQLMYPSARPLVTNLGRGDLTGLAALGTGRCFAEL